MGSFSLFALPLLGAIILVAAAVIAVFVVRKQNKK